MNEYMIWFWLAVFVIAVGFEFATTEFVSIWFAIAAIPSLLIAIFAPGSLWLEVIVFFAVGFVLMALTRPLVVKYFRRNVVDTNVDAYIGKIALVIKSISDVQYGSVKFEGIEWTAMSNESIEAGAKVKILAIEGNKLIVTKIDN